MVSLLPLDEPRPRSADVVQIAAKPGAPEPDSDGTEAQLREALSCLRGASRVWALCNSILPAPTSSAMPTSPG